MELLANKATTSAGARRDPSQNNGELLVQQHSEGNYPLAGLHKATSNLRGQWNLMDEELRSVASQFKKFSV